MWLKIFIVVFIICMLLYYDTIKPKKFPPGPKWYPILGCVYEINKLRLKTGYLYKTVKLLTEIYCRDSPLIGLKVGKDRIVIVNSPEANREMMQNEDIDGRPRGIFYQTRTWGERRGIIMVDGELWKEQRKFLIKQLREFGFGRKEMGEIVHSEASKIIIDIMECIGNNGSVVMEMHNFFNMYILNTLWATMAGLTYKRKDPNMIILQEMLFDLFAAIDMIGCAFSHFPILSILAPKASGYTNFVKTHKKIWKYLREEIARHKLRFDINAKDKDFMDAYIRVLKEHGEINTYSEDQLVAICLDMFMAGTETTSKSMSFCFSYLVREQEIQKKAQDEIDRVIGRDRMPCISDRPDMPYNEAIVHESVRHIMGRTFSIPRRALRDTTLAGYNIPKETMVLSNYTSILMDPVLYPDPYEFKPERFLSDGKISLPDHYFPFGLNKHRCLGDALAKSNIFVFTTTVLQNFTLVPVPGEAPPSLDHLDGATPSAAPFKCLIQPRLKTN